MERPEQNRAEITPAAPRGENGDVRLRSLVRSGRLTVDRKLAFELNGDRTVAIVRVALAPGVTEPRHTHPGLAILYGLDGVGFVELDHRERIPISRDTLVRVAAGQVKSLGNGSGSEPFAVLAVLVLEKDRPPLKTVD